ncbi:MAG: cation:proton antiporter [Planctomycetaceae bacterium]|nr:cation:proton antiporter [Planctomycetaceae bacterium]
MVLTFSLGILLVAGVIAGYLAGWVGVPKVCLYILAGLFIGPSLLGWIPEDHLHELDPVLKLALAMVLLEIGSRFKVGMIRRIIRSAVPLSLGELGMTFGLVAGGLYLYGETLEVSLLLGGLALATAPATTIVVLREYDSEGPVTAYTFFLVALNNLAAIIGFEVLFAATSLMKPETDIDVMSRLMWLLTDLVGSTLLGIFAGVVVSIVSSLTKERQRTLAVFAITAFVLGLCETFHMPYLLTFLAMGVTLANASRHTQETLKGLGTVLALLYVVFFVAAGAELDLKALAAVGNIGAIYVVMRIAGKYFGIRSIARWRQEPIEVQRWLGATLIAQAGAAIGLVQIASERDPELGAYLSTIIVGTVVVFEVLGPLLTRFAVVHAGEVPVAHLVHPERPGLVGSIKNVVSQIRMSFGHDPLMTKNRSDLKVGDLMRKNVRSISNSADFLEVLDFIEHSRHQIYPVTDAEGNLLSVIRYRDLRTVLFDREVASLVRAEDLSVEVSLCLSPEVPIQEAFNRCEKTIDDVIPVVESSETMRLVGLLERRDIVRFIKTDHKAPRKS